MVSNTVVFKRISVAVIILLLVYFIIDLTVFQKLILAGKHEEQGAVAVKSEKKSIWSSFQNSGKKASTNSSTLDKFLNCTNKSLTPHSAQRGPYWVYYNYIRATRTFQCNESITYTTHGDFTFLENLVTLCERWQGPVSISVYAPKSDFDESVQTILYLRECVSVLVKEYVTFHIFFETEFPPVIIPDFDAVSNMSFDCTDENFSLDFSDVLTFRKRKKLTYPVNVARNVAREMATTHFIYPSDVELFPNPELIPDFLNMVLRNPPELQRPSPKVFVLSIFEVESNASLPNTKTELVQMLRNGTAIKFHQKICKTCHAVPKAAEWVKAKETSELNVFHVSKRKKPFDHWEPIFICTNDEPFYDERLSWEGQSDKMPQGYALCVLDYEFHILDNAFLTHKPGIKIYKKDPKRLSVVDKQNTLIRGVIFEELKRTYGRRKGCKLH